MKSIERPSFITSMRSVWGILAESVMVVVFVMAAALALSTIEGIIETGTPKAVDAAEMPALQEGRTPWWHAMLGIHTAHAAELKGYEALQTSAVPKLTMKPGESKTVSVSFLNIGTKTWVNSGAGYVSLYTYEPKYRVSVFQDASWLLVSQPAKLKETSVVKNSVGTLSFTLVAPKMVGSYKETFQLAAEDVAWIPGGSFTIAITVADAATKTVSTPTASTTTPSAATSTSDAALYEGEVTSLGESTITAKGGVSIVYSVSIKNTGTKSWGSRTLSPDSVQMADVSATDIKHKSWKSSAIVLTRSNAVASGQSDTFSFAFMTPKYKGSYDLKFQLAADGEEIEGGVIDIPVDVTSDAPGVKDSPSKNKEKKAKKKKTASSVYTEHIVTEEPIMRVGILIVDEETDDEVVISSPVSMNVEDTDGNILATVDAGEEVTAYFMTSKSKYYYEIDGEKEKSSLPLRFVPAEENAILTITNFDRKVTRGSAYSDNQFRNILEIRHNDVKERTWLINELKMETYLKGLAETSNISPAEFQKTLITAARTYGYYHWQRNTKHDAEGFTVDAYADQVYKGYGQEARTPNLSAAVDATRGVTVTYNGETAITAYFSRSAGTTLDWSDVWGGSVPWCKAVPVPWDEGKTLWGHGVGMSASGALGAANDGWSYDKILKYFYTGIDLEKRWK